MFRDQFRIEDDGLVMAGMYRFKFINKVNDRMQGIRRKKDVGKKTSAANQKVKLEKNLRKRIWF